MELPQLLHVMVEQQAADLFLIADAPPVLRCNDKLRAVGKELLTPEITQHLAEQAMSAEQKQVFDDHSELNLALTIENEGRFRVNIFRQQDQTAIVIRQIALSIPEPDELGIPEITKELILKERGLIIFIGPAGTGKSTTMASLIEYRNAQSGGHIICIEDPIEFLHKHKKSIISQREVGIDTESYEIALANALRQSPDVIMIGEARSYEVIAKALEASETGHLCMTTLHANNSSEALERIISFFPEGKRQQLLLDLSLNLVAIISQRLIPSIEGEKRIAAFEVLINTQAIADAIREGDINTIKDLMQQENTSGMQTFDNDLLRLQQEGKISEEEALKYADSENNFRIKNKLNRGIDPSTDIDDNLTIDQPESGNKPN